ncbi:hypothetical protein [Bacillus mycoides]|uniref:hypothetical protein n=1 Tax=Bacillus mycoides TaxID=1405 RepID=UPI001C0C4561|nr:hypothetical protein [Bacillus mycoides]
MQENSNVIFIFSVKLMERGKINYILMFLVWKVEFMTLLECNKEKIEEGKRAERNRGDLLDILDNEQ